MTTSAQAAPVATPPSTVVGPQEVTALASPNGIWASGVVAPS